MLATSPQHLQARLSAKQRAVTARYPHLASRFARGVELYASGAVRVLEPHEVYRAGPRADRWVDVLAEVRTPRPGKGPYTITQARGFGLPRYVCNCRDSFDAPATAIAQHTCKHIVAYVLAIIR